jgi:hypothetical protein
MSEQKRLGDNGTSAATAKESGDRGDEMDEKDGQVAHLANVLISTSVTRLGTRWDLCDKSEFATDSVATPRRGSLWRSCRTSVQQVSLSSAAAHR